MSTPQHKGSMPVFHNHSVFISNLQISLICRMAHVGSSLKLLDGRLIEVTRNTKVFNCWGLHYHKQVERLEFIVTRLEFLLLILEASLCFKTASKEGHHVNYLGFFYHDWEIWILDQNEIAKLG